MYALTTLKISMKKNYYFLSYKQEGKIIEVDYINSQQWKIKFKK